MIDLGACDVVFLSFDEPNADAHWDLIKTAVPRAQRVHGVKGFDAAHARAGAIATSAFVVTIDADNLLLDPSFLSARFDVAPRDRGRVFSFSARNRINGLRYGNGGVKIWPRTALQTLRTHEKAATPTAAADFCWTVPYYQVNRLLSEIDVTGSPYQAFRAGFREGVKLNMADGILAYAAHPDLPPPEALVTHVGQRNLERLRVWCTVGLDVPLGDWAIFGARLGCFMTACEGFDVSRVSDYAWFDGFWRDSIRDHYSDDGLRHLRSRDLGEKINQYLSLGVEDLDAQSSGERRRQMRSFRAFGPMHTV